MDLSDPSAVGALAERVDNSIAKSAIRKASIRLLPLAGLGYGVAYVDRTNISFAALQMNRDLHFSASIYGFGAGLFFISYAFCEIPSNLMLVRFGARRWLARVLVTWGALAAGMMFVKTPVQFYAMRFLLGVAEAGFLPGILYYLTQWFPPDLHARSISRFYLSLPISSAVMGALAGGLMNLEGSLGLAGWQWLFLLEGIPALGLAVVFFFFLPDSPAEAGWLTPNERKWMLSCRADPGDPLQRNSLHSVSAALLDRRVWQIGVHRLCLVLCIYGFEFSAPVILREVTGFTLARVGYTLAAMHLMGAVAMIMNGRHSDRTGERYCHIIVPCAFMGIGFLACGLSAAPIAALPGFALVLVGFNAMQGTVWAIPPEFLTGKSAAAGIAAINTFAILGGFVGPYWMGLIKDMGGTYQRGLLTLVVPVVAATVIMWQMRRQAHLEAVNSSLRN